MTQWTWRKEAESGDNVYNNHWRFPNVGVVVPICMGPVTASCGAEQRCAGSTAALAAFSKFTLAALPMCSSNRSPAGSLLPPTPPPLQLPPSLPRRLAEWRQGVEGESETMRAASLRHLHPLTWDVKSVVSLSVSCGRLTDLYAGCECNSLQNASFTHSLILGCAHISSTTLF